MQNGRNVTVFDATVRRLPNQSNGILLADSHAHALAKATGAAACDVVSMNSHYDGVSNDYRAGRIHHHGTNSHHLPARSDYAGVDTDYRPVRSHYAAVATDYRAARIHRALLRSRYFCALSPYARKRSK